ncbi:metallophosphoesterase family protein [Catellatospora tritici]|uniref:metallophosphoesterase family protein n=1 Tax=Catellatospora tritici TaxID=2851566 RepID=UPI001C2D4A01|nr:metallophosphoesterase [Catellatospora tritici]
MDGWVRHRMAGLYAISDLHVAYPQNREYALSLRPDDPGDWLIVAGDVAENVADVATVLETLASRWAKVIWSPGNHELWTSPHDPVQVRGTDRYDLLVKVCRELDVATPEDPFPVWSGPGGPVTVAPLFLLYDYTFRPAGAKNKEEGLAQAYAEGIVCSDEYVLHPDPYPSREAWCRARVEHTQRRLAERDETLPTVLVNHWPLTRTPTLVLRYPVFAQWCGTELSADWHVRYRAAAVVYGHLHIPRTTWEDGVRFEEVSVGYPREWGHRGPTPPKPRLILPVAA